MLSHEPGLSSPRSPSKRAGFNAPGTQQPYSSSRNQIASPPRTPPSQGSRSARIRQLPSQQRALAVRPSLRETFLDDITPTDNVRGNAGHMERDSFGERDMHDLSLSPRHITRASVFDNMLLSLDQFESQSPERIDDSRNYSAPYDTDTDSSNPRYASVKTSRGRGHTFSSSLSSHNPNVADDPPFSRRSNQSARTNWGGGSGIYQAGQGTARIVSPEDFISTRGKVYEAQRAMPPTERPRTKGRKNSKSSASSSVDFGSMMASSRIGGQPIDRRSDSFDYPRTHRKAQSLESTNGLSTILSPTHSHHSRIDSIDVAPTPTVPAGPRPTHYFPPQPTHAPPQAPNLIRKNSAKSSKSRKGRPETLGTSSIKGRGNEFATIRDVAELPVIPAFIQSGPAPSPTISLHKPSVQSSASAETTPQQSKEQRPGFFRRVFGSRNVTPSLENFQASLSHTDSNISRESDRGLPLEEQQVSAPQARLQKQAPKESTPTPTLPQKEPPSLNKKPSSFFRRRKKSVSEHTPPPVLIPPVQQALRLAERTKEIDPSPVTSLRKAMDPYLHGSPQPSPLHSPHYFDTKENFDSDADSDCDEQYVERHFSTMRLQQTSFSEPKLRKNKPNSVPRSYTTPIVETGVRKPASSNNLSVPSHRPRTSRDADDSFLADSSGNEGPSSVSSQENLRSMQQVPNRRPKTSPAKPAHDEDVSLQDRNINLPPQSFANSEDKARMSDEATRRVKSTFDDRKDSGRASDSSLPLRTNSRDQQGENLKPVTSSREHLSPSSSPLVGHGWLEPASSEERLNEPLKLSLPIDGVRESPKASASDLSSYKSANSTPVLSTPVIPPDDVFKATVSAPVINVEHDEPTELDRECAQRMFDGEDDGISQANLAAWLGEHEPERERVRRAYMQLFSWSGMSILAAMRRLCAHISLKGETQQLDRILDSFSTRWCECNPNHGFKATDVVHTICYSVLLLNTDLHVADIDQKMTRAQFVRNTLPTIRRVVTEAAPDAFHINLKISVNNTKIASDQPPSPMLKSPTAIPDGLDSRPSVDVEHPARPSARPTDRLAREDSTGNPDDVPSNDCGPLVTTPFTGVRKVWENQIEIVLKNFYNSIQKERLPLYGVNQEPADPSTSSTSFLNLGGNMLRRSPSTLSKAASETLNVRGRMLDNRIGTGRWTSKTRSRPRFGGSSTIGSSRTSFDDGSSAWSPAGSSTWSKNSLGKTLTSMSVDSFGSDFPRGDYQQSIGFANALSQAIIREENAPFAGHEEPMRQIPLLEDESLELAGAPWAKEGMLKHKHHLDGVDKKAKDRGWNECFAVIEKGWMRLFSFNLSAKSLRLKNKNRNIAGGVVGGGNWTDNAEEVWKFLLRQTIASALPPPGYSKARPHVWALSLPTGAVHLFQVGTPDIVKEFVASANYWSARLSKEPLVGGISNIEYGWSESVVNRAIIHTESLPAGMTSLDRSRPSLQSSIRSSIDQGTVRAKLPGDRANINEWTIPQQSMMASALLEVDQLKALQTYVKNVEDDLQKHNELRGAMNLAFSPRHPNSQKAMANWERKSSYLLREIVKFRTYIDSLQHAQTQKDKIYAQRAAEQAERQALWQQQEQQGGPVSPAVDDQEEVPT